MKRKAILVAAPGDLPGANPKNKLPGTKIDIENMYGFLQSPVGGAWTADEITVLVDPSLIELRSYFPHLLAADYSYFHFAGHGRHIESKDSTQMMLRPNEWVDTSLIVNSSAQKSTVVVDACREIVRKDILKATLEAFSSQRKIISRSDARQVFDAQVELCRPMDVQLYSCSRDELANEDSERGGLYTAALVDSSGSWNRSLGQSRILSVRDAHEAAAAKVKGSTRNRQNPHSVYPRTENYFPFAVRSAGF